MRYLVIIHLTLGGSFSKSFCFSISVSAIPNRFLSSLIKPSLEVQAIARAHRMGQVNVVQVHRLLIPESIDELMVNMLKRKQAEFDDYVKESELANSPTRFSSGVPVRKIARGLLSNHLTIVLVLPASRFFT